jgi:hypothetical protein
MNRPACFTQLATCVILTMMTTSQPTLADPPAVTLPVIDLNNRAAMQTVVDREPGQYLGHPTTLLLEDGKTILCVYPKGHGPGMAARRGRSDFQRLRAGKLLSKRRRSTA